MKLDLLTSIYNDQYKWFYDELNNLISTLNLENLIKINGNYLSNQVSLDLLSNTDLIIFPYQSTNESSSAAVRHGLASGTPVAVTSLSIFDDVSNVVHFLPGFSPLDIAKGVIKWNNKNRCDQIPGKKKWMEANRFSSLGLRLEGMIRSLALNE